MQPINDTQESIKDTREGSKIIFDGSNDNRGDIGDG